MRTCARPDCPGVQRPGGEPLECSGGVDRCAACGEPLSPSPGERERQDETRHRPELPDIPRRLLVTVAAVALVVAGRLVVAPGIDLDALREVDRLSGDLAVGVPRGPVSVLAVGLAPLFTAAVGVEILAWAILRWRFAGTYRGELRRRIDVIGLCLGTILAVVQACGLTSVWMKAGGPECVNPASWLSFVAGSLGLWGLARLVSRRGLVDGLALILVTERLVHWTQTLLDPVGRGRAPLLDGFHADHGQGTILALLAMGIVAVGSSRLLRRGATTAHRDAPVAENYRQPSGGATTAVTLGAPLPASGTVPLVALTLGHSLQTFLDVWVGPPGPLLDALRVLLTHPTTGVLLALILTLPLAHLYQPTAPLVRLAERLFPGVPDTEAWVIGWNRASLGRAFLINGVIASLAALLLLLGVSVWLDLTAAVLAAALLVDARSEAMVRARHPHLELILEEHRPHVAALLASRLMADGIPVVTRNLEVRAMLRFFGPYAPVALLVPPAQAAQARRSVRAWLEEPSRARATAHGAT